MGEFNWVKARTECTVENEFHRLKEMVKQDLDLHQELNPGTSQSQSFHVCGDGTKFYIQRKGQYRIIFEILHGRICIGRWTQQGEHKPLMELTVSLDDNGQCVLTDRECHVRQSWQVRRKALEEAFFG